MKNERWQWRPLGELFEISAGKTMSAVAREGDNKTSFLRTSNVFWDEIDLSVVDEMTIPPHELAEKLLKAGDLLVCEGGDIGRSAIWNGEVETMSFQNHLHRLRPLTDDVDPRFYVYFLQCAFTQLRIFEGAGNKTTIPNLSQNRLAELEVPQPEIEEQRAITQALAWVRSAMKFHDRSTAIAQELKRTSMRELFTRGLRSEAQKRTDIGLVPDSWSVDRLDRFADVISTRMSYSELEQIDPTESDDGVNVLGIKVGDMNRPGNEVGLHHAGLEKLIPRAVVQSRCAPPRTIIFPKRGAAIATNKKRISYEWTAFDPNVIGVVAQEHLDQEYLFHWFQGFDLRTITEPGPTPQLNKKNLEPVTIPVPSTMEEQREIVALLNAIDRKIDLHKRKRGLLGDLFKALLHKLITGEIRSSDLDLGALAKAPPEGVSV